MQKAIRANTHCGLWMQFRHQTQNVHASSMHICRICHSNVGHHCTDVAISARLCSVTFMHELCHIRKLLTISDIKMVATAVVSWLDHCNSLLYFITVCNISKLQSIQNSFACHITKSSLICSTYDQLQSLDNRDANIPQKTT